MDYEKYAEVPKLVDEYQQVVENANQYILDLETDERLVKKLSNVQHWYYITGNKGRIFAPSKFIGYQNNNVDYYEKYTVIAMTGVDTERVLKQWFKKVEKNSECENQLMNQLVEFLESYDKKPNKRACIHIQK